VGNDVNESRAPVLQGYSVALSADGNTAIVGGPGDANPYQAWGAGAAWVYTRSGGVWTQQGPKLSGNDVIVFPAQGWTVPAQGWSVALSADGNTAIVGGPNDAAYPSEPGLGATWVYVRSDGVWTQQGPKLVGSGAVGTAQQGTSVALSGDGNTAIVSGPSDNSGAGAVWVFTRSDGVWTQQGEKQVLSVNSLALSADGDTAVMGGSGMSYVYIRTGGVWTQQGPVLVGAGAVGASEQGYSVGITGDGNTVIVGGPEDNSDAGAGWLFARNADNWTQLGSKLVGTGAVGAAQQGWSVALSGDGNTALLGGFNDASGVGAAWVFVEPPSLAQRTNTHDFNGDGYSDIAWRNTNGDVYTWLMNGFQILESSDLGNVSAVWSVAGIGDFNGDGKSDILWRNTNGDVYIWLMNGFQLTSGADLGNVPLVWSIAGVGDFNGDGTRDILWRNTGGDVAIWLMNGSQVLSAADLGNVPTAWAIQGSNAD
jgi:FG-GAP-like repeat